MHISDIVNFANTIIMDELAFIFGVVYTTGLNHSHNIGNDDYQFDETSNIDDMRQQELYNIVRTLNLNEFSVIIGFIYEKGVGDSCPGDYTDGPSSRNNTDFAWTSVLNSLYNSSNRYFNMGVLFYKNLINVRDFPELTDWDIYNNEVYPTIMWNKVKNAVYESQDMSVGYEFDCGHTFAKNYMQKGLKKGK